MKRTDDDEMKRIADSARKKSADVKRIVVSASRRIVDARSDATERRNTKSRPGRTGIEATRTATTQSTRNRPRDTRRRRVVEKNRTGKRVKNQKRYPVAQSSRSFSTCFISIL